MNPNLWRTVATLKILLPVTEEIGNCWFQVGIALDLSEATLFNIWEDYKYNKHKAIQVLRTWTQKHGNNATMGRLAAVLVGIERRDIVHKLLGVCSH